MRSIAVLLVLVFHFDLVWGAKSGFIGVDVFFVISGYLITSIVLAQLEAGSFSLGTFYLNRIRRLAPALFTTLVLVTIGGWLLLFPKDFESLILEVLAAQFYVANIFYWQNISYFALQSENVLLLHTWSLAVEEQFYLFYPVILILTLKYLKKYLFYILLTAGLISFLLNILFVGIKPEATFYLLPTRAWELLAGAMVYFMIQSRWISKVVAEIVGLIGFASIIIAITLFDNSIRFPGYFALLPTAGAICLIISGTHHVTSASKFLSLPPLVYIGKISYPLYLVHWPINVFARIQLEDEYSFVMRVLAFGASVVLSAVIYHAVENPIRYRRVLVGNTGLGRGYLAALTATVAMFGWVNASGGLPNRFPVEALRLAAYAEHRPNAARSCEFLGGSLDRVSDFCRIGAPGVEPTWLVYGDSHAWAGYPAFDIWLKSRGQAGLFKFRSSCPPILGVYLFRGKEACFNFNQKIVGFLERESSVRNVLLVSIWRQPLEARLTSSSDLLLSTDESIRLFDKEFSNTIKRLSDAGTNVYIWEPVPGARANVPISMARSSVTNRLYDLEFDTEAYRATYDYFFRAVEKNKDLIKFSFSPSEALCKNGRCAVTINGNPAYSDNNHIASSGAEFWADVMSRQQPD